MTELEERLELQKKYFESGIESLDEKEILCLILSLSSADFNDAADRLINEYGSLKIIEDADSHLLIKRTGLDVRSAVLLKMIPEISRLYSIKGKKIVSLRSSGTAAEYFSDFFIGCRDEQLAAVCTDKKLNIISSAVISCGSAASVKSSCSKIVSFALDSGADCMIIAHNHPNGRAVPSPGDYASTEMLFSALKRLGIALLDHIIIGTDGAVSMRSLPSPLSLGGENSFGYRTDQNV